jgi:hypothetical protein
MRHLVLLASVLIGCGPPVEETSSPPPDDTPICEQHVTGQVSLYNSSTSAESVVINGIFYGTLPSGQSMDLDLPPGEYSVHFVWADGSDACTAAFITISVCSTQTLNCAG